MTFQVDTSRKEGRLRGEGSGGRGQQCKVPDGQDSGVFREQRSHSAESGVSRKRRGMSAVGQPGAQDSASTWDFFPGVKGSHWGEGVCEQGTGMA